MVLGTPARFQCFGRIMKWLFDDDELPENAIVSSQGVLTIEDTTYENEGYYECVGRKYSGNSTFHARGFLEVFGNCDHFPLLFLTL